MSEYHSHCLDRSNLTRNQALVLDALDASQQPLTAYALLDGLREDGLRNPPQVYRALDRLTERGLAHRIESLNAFLSCKQSRCSGEALTAFAICEDCAHVDELDHNALAQRLGGLLSDSGFTLNSASIELRGRCANCA